MTSRRFTPSASRADAITIRKFIDEGAASEQAGRSERLDALVRYAETSTCRRVPLLGYFDERDTLPCGHCDNCRAGEHAVELADVAGAARKFIACVEQAGECFGPAHIIGVHRGSKSKRVLERRHNQLAVYGSGLEFSAEVWRELARQFIEQDLVGQDLQFGGLRLTARGRALRTGGKVLARLKPEAPSTPAGSTEPMEHDPGLFERLRKLRRELAAQAGVPAYVVFSDRALAEMATRMPRTPGQFLAINGVGEAKLARYGDAFLKAIGDSCATHSTPPPTVATPPLEPTHWPTAHHRYKEIGEAFAAGQSLDDLVKNFGIKPETALQNLTRFAESGGKVDGERLLRCSHLSKSERDRVIRAFEQFGLERLGPVHEALGGSILYEELHLLRLWLKCRLTAS